MNKFKKCKFHSGTCKKYNDRFFHISGKEILVGISKRTNKAGVAAVAEAFPGFPTLGIEVSGPLHLKTLLGQIGDDTLCVSSETGHSMAMYEVIIETTNNCQFKSKSRAI